MPICSKCGDDKEADLFIKRCEEGRRGKLSSWCKSCFTKNQMIHWNALKIEIIEALGNKCKDCNKKFHPALYDLHHTDPKLKLFEWKDLRKKSKADAWKEASKCILLCGNCHRFRHINLDTWVAAGLVVERRRSTTNRMVS